MRFYSCYAFDLDGTLYRGNDVVPGAADTIRQLEERGAKILYVTNNSGLMRADYVDKLHKLGFNATVEQVVTSGVVAAQYCLSRGLNKVFIVGEPGLVGTFQEHGLTVINADSPLESENAQAVVSGICRATLSYNLIDAAMQVAMQTQTYIACNRDLTYPVEGGRFCPGSGSIVAAIEACSGVKAITVGKPQPEMLLEPLKALGINPKDALMVGDRMDTDIECGKAAGADTCLVLTGVTQQAVLGQLSLDSVRDLV